MAFYDRSYAVEVNPQKRFGGKKPTLKLYRISNIEDEMLDEKPRGGGEDDFFNDTRDVRCYNCRLTDMQRKSAFSRRLPDLVTEELVAVLSKKGASFEFKQLFDIIHERLKKRNAASGGEEMLRLRAYEKLQHLVSRNMVKKTGKKYKGLAALANALAPAEPVPSKAAAEAA